MGKIIKNLKNVIVTIYQKDSYEYIPVLNGKERHQFFKIILTSNCKVDILDGIGYLIECSITGNQIKNTVDALKSAMEYGKQLYFTTLIRESDVEFLKKHFKVAHVEKFPIGYTGGYQYHVIIDNSKGGYKKRMQNEYYNKKLLDLKKNPESFTREDLIKAFRAGRKDDSYHITSGFRKFIETLNNEK